MCCCLSYPSSSSYYVGRSKSKAYYLDIHLHCKEWKKDNISPCSGGIIANDLDGISPQSARFKDGSNIMEHVTKVIKRVVTNQKKTSSEWPSHIWQSAFKRNLQLIFRSQRKER